MSPSTEPRMRRRTSVGVARERSGAPLPQAIAACVAFAAFAVSIVVGLASDNPTETVLTRALVSLGCGAFGGFAVGLVCDWLGGQHAAPAAKASEAENAEDADGSREFGASSTDVDAPEAASGPARPA